MNTHRSGHLSKPLSIFRVWRLWTVAPSYSKQLRLLERRVTAAGFGVNSPQKFTAHSQLLRKHLRTLPALP